MFKHLKYRIAPLSYVGCSDVMKTYGITYLLNPRFHSINHSFRTLCFFYEANVLVKYST